MTSETGNTAGDNLSQLEDSVIESRLQTEVLPLQQYTFSAISDYYCHSIYRTAQVTSCIENGIAADLMGSVRV